MIINDFDSLQYPITGRLWRSYKASDVFRKRSAVAYTPTMATYRTYSDACGMAHALDLVGERWALLIVRELVLGAKRYSDLKSDLPGISTNVLSHRLDELERAGVLTRRRLPPPAASWVYELTDWGRELEPIIQQLGRWGARSPSHPLDAHLSVTSFVLSLRTNFDPAAAGDLAAECEIRLGEDWFRARVASGRFTMTRGQAEHPDAIVDSSPGALASIIYGGRDLDEAIAAGDVSIEGDRGRFERMCKLFVLPAPARCAPVGTGN
jgi:DNA-binding HxlR family transcriptional regulator